MLCIKVKFSRKSRYTEEAEFDDPIAENVVRAIIIGKLDQLLGGSVIKSTVIPDGKQDIKAQPIKSNINTGN